MNDDKPAEIEEFDINSLANSLLTKIEEEPNEEIVEKTAPDVADVPPAEEASKEPVEGETPPETADADKPAESPDDKVESDPPEEIKPLSREDIRAALREENAERERISNERLTYAGQVREDLKEALKLDTQFTTPTLADGTPVTSVTQLTQVINPDTDEPYTREEATSLLLDAQRIVQENLNANAEQVDKLTDLNVNFKEEADRVDELYGDILRTFPDVAKDLLEAYQKTFKLSADGKYVEEAPVSPLEFYGPALRPFRNATDQFRQQEAEAKAAEQQAIREAEAKAEQEDRGDIGSSAGEVKGKPDLLEDALNNYINR